MSALAASASGTTTVKFEISTWDKDLGLKQWKLSNLRVLLTHSRLKSALTHTESKYITYSFRFVLLASYVLSTFVIDGQVRREIFYIKLSITQFY